MWIITSDKTKAINENELKELAVQSLDEYGFCMIDEDEIAGYGVFSGFQLVAGPYRNKSKAFDILIDIIINVGRQNPYYCPKSDFEVKND